MKKNQMFFISLAWFCSLAYSSLLPLNKTECLESHNIYRAIHQAASLNWSDTLAARAQIWADDLANRNAFVHDNGRGLEGENLYRSAEDSTTACKRGTDHFYNEEQFYDYENPGYSISVGHFTQVVWLDTKELGVAKANTSDGHVILVYRYLPSGNYLGEFAQNVKPPLNQSATHIESLLLYCFTVIILILVF